MIIKIKKIILFAFMLWLPLSLFAETIIFKSGKKIESKIIERGDDYIKIDLYGMPITYYRDDIESIADNTTDRHKIISATAAAETVERKYEKYKLKFLLLSSAPGGLKDFITDVMNDIQKLSERVIQNVSAFQQAVKNTALRYRIIDSAYKSETQFNNVKRAINKRLNAEGLHLHIAETDEGTEWKPSICLAHIKEQQSRTIPVELLGKQISADVVILDRFYFDTSDSSSFVSVTDTGLITNIIYHKFYASYNNGIKTFLLFDFLQNRGINIQNEEFLENENIYAANNNYNIPTFGLLDQQLMYRAWRGLYLKAIKAYNDEKDRVNYFSRNYAAILMVSSTAHEATHLAQDLQKFFRNNKVFMAEFEAYANQLLQADDAFATLSLLVSTLGKGMFENSNDPNSLGAVSLLSLLAESYCTYMNKPAPRFDNPDNLPEALFRVLKGIDKLSDKELSQVVKMMRESKLKKYGQHNINKGALYRK